MQWIIPAIFAIGVVVFFLLPRAERGTIENLKDRFAALRRGETEEGFFGFHTKNVDCMYFAYEDGYFWFEYELADEERKGYESRVRDLARELNLRDEDGKYGDVPIVRVRLDGTEEKSANLVYVFADKLFGITPTDTVQFVP